MTTKRTDNDTKGTCRRMEFDSEKAKHILELKQLASDICKHYVFTSYHIPEKKMDEMFTVVYPIFTSSNEFKHKLNRDEIGFIYEYMDKADDKGKWVDGYPTFKSFQWLDKKDAELLRGFVNGIMAKKKKVKATEME